MFLFVGGGKKKAGKVPREGETAGQAGHKKGARAGAPGNSISKSNEACCTQQHLVEEGATYQPVARMQLAESGV